MKDTLGFEFAAARQVLTSVAGLPLLPTLIRQHNLPRAILGEVRVKKIDCGFREEEYLPALKRVGAKMLSEVALSAEPGARAYLPLDVDPSIFE